MNPVSGSSSSGTGGSHHNAAGLEAEGFVTLPSDLPDLAVDDLAGLDSPNDSDFIARLFLNEDDFPSLMDTSPSPQHVNSMSNTPPTLSFPLTPPTPPTLFPSAMLLPGYHPPLLHQHQQPPSIPISQQPPPQPHHRTSPGITTARTTKGCKLHPQHHPHHQLQQQQQQQQPVQYQHPRAGFPFLPTGQPKQVIGI